MIALMILAACSASEFMVEIAPDQPIPHVFVDEPLVLELGSTDDSATTLSVALERAGHDPIVEEPMSVPLRGGTRQWLRIAAPGLPLGNYSASISMESAGATTTVRREFCVMDRPTASADIHAVANVDGADTGLVLALADMPVATVRVSAAHANLDELARACRASGLSMALILENEPALASAGSEAESPAPSDAEARAERLARSYGERTAWWEVPASSGPEAVLMAVAALRRGGSRAPVLAAVASPQEVTDLLNAGVGRAIAGLAVTSADVSANDMADFRKAAERCGYERLAVHHVSLFAAAGAAEAEAVRTLIAARALSPADHAFPASAAYAGEAFQPAYVTLSAMAHRLSDSSYVGRVRIKGSGAAYLFRSGADWILVGWSDDAAEVEIDAGGATDLRLTDAYTNDIPLRLNEERVLLPLGSAPIYLNGRGGSILAAAATDAAATEAKSMIEVLGELTALEPLRPALETIASANAVDRLTFMGLVQALPDIEKSWHLGTLSRAQAVPSLAALARLVRVLAVLEQEKGEEFVESLQNVVARCGEYQSVYLMSTGSNGTQHERGDWLMDDVNRLVHDAEVLRDAGRPIEAVAVASVAEARARALEFAAAAAPLSEAEPTPAPEAETQSEPTNET